MSIFSKAMGGVEEGGRLQVQIRALYLSRCVGEQAGAVEDACERHLTAAVAVAITATATTCSRFGVLRFVEDFDDVLGTEFNNIAFG